MQWLTDPPDPADPARVQIEAGRTVDRLRSLSVVRLRAPLPDGLTRAERAFRLAQQLVDQTAELAGWPERRLPELPATAAGDVLAVCAADLVEALRQRPDPVAAERASEALVALRRAL